MRKAFTLVELLVIIGIMAAMVTMSVISVRSGQEAFRLKGATRDILAKVRYARSVALVSRNSVKVIYSNTSVDGESAAKIEVEPMDDGFISENIPSRIQTLSGKPLPGVDLESKLEEKDTGSGENGDTIVSMLKPEIDTSLVQGIAIKVIGSNEAKQANHSQAQKRSRMSVSGTNFKLKDISAEESSSESASTKSQDLSVGEIGEVIWSSLGITEEHTIYVYVEGTDYSDGYKIHVDEMGGVKVYGPNEEIDKW